MVRGNTIAIQADTTPPTPAERDPVTQPEEQRDLVIPIAVAVAFAAYTAIAIIGLFF